MHKRSLFLFMLTTTISLSAEIDKKELKKYLPKNPVIVDAGAHNGSGALELCKIWPQGRIYAFEPVPRLFSLLVRNTRFYRNIRTFPYALSDKNGKDTMYVSHGLGDGSSSLLQPKEHLEHFPAVSFPRTIEVRTVILDDWAQKEGVEHIDFLWLDMQGAEYKALKASPRTLKQVKAIYSEFSLVELYKGCMLYPEFKKWLESLGFKEVYKELIHKTFGDALFVRQDN